MKKFIVAVCFQVGVFVFTPVSFLSAQRLTENSQSGIYFGAAWTTCRDLFILAKFDIVRIEGTYNGLALNAGYSWFSGSENIGWGIGVLFIPLPCKNFELDYLEGKDPYTNVKYHFWLTDPHLSFRIADKLRTELYFLFGMGISYYDVKVTNYFSPQISFIKSDYRTDFQGGAGLGLRYIATRHILLTFDYRLMVGMTEGGGEYDLWINGVNTGSAGGESHYSKIFSFGARYWF